MGRMIALATRYEVRTQVDSSTLAERLPAMCGRDTLTTVVSSTSMKVPNITAIAIIHGLITGSCLSVIAEAELLTLGILPHAYLKITVGSTDMPGRSRCSGSSPLSKLMRTGTRCTTFTKLPVAFSGGNKLKRAPVAPPKVNT